MSDIGVLFSSMAKDLSGYNVYRRVISNVLLYFCGENLHLWARLSSNLGEISDIVDISSSFSVKSFANSRPAQLTTLSTVLATQYNILAVLRSK